MGSIRSFNLECQWQYHLAGVFSSVVIAIQLYWSSIFVSCGYELAIACDCIPCKFWLQNLFVFCLLFSFRERTYQNLKSHHSQIAFQLKCRGRPCLLLRISERVVSSKRVTTRAADSLPITRRASCLRLTLRVCYFLPARCDRDCLPIK